jgi:hypothetical protein
MRFAVANLIFGVVSGPVERNTAVVVIELESTMEQPGDGSVGVSSSACSCLSFSFISAGAFGISAADLSQYPAMTGMDRAIF